MFILVFIDIYLFFSILWVGVGDTSPIPPCSTVEARDGIPIHPVPRWERKWERKWGRKWETGGGIRYEGRRYEGYIAPLAHRGTRGLGGWNPPVGSEIGRQGGV